MPRYIVEREFPGGLRIPIDENGCRACMAVVETNLADQVTWIHSYVSTDKKHTPRRSDRQSGTRPPGCMAASSSVAHTDLRKLCTRHCAPRLEAAFRPANEPPQVGCPLDSCRQIETLHGSELSH